MLKTFLGTQESNFKLILLNFDSSQFARQVQINISWRRKLLMNQLNFKQVIMAS